MGRAIFIGALEYQLSAFAGRLQRREEIPPSPEPHRDAAMEQALADIATRSRALAGLLRDLPDAPRAGLTAALSTRDRFARGYDACYLRELTCELERLERACAASAVPEETAPPAEDPGPSRPFVAKLAKIFAECFEMAPTADEDGPFRAALEVLDAETGLVIGHSPELLAQVLRSSPSG
jgi:hypothetical protein